MRLTATAAVVLALALPMAGQGQHNDDPDKNVQGSGTLPSGWQARLDQPTAKMSDLSFRTMGAGFHSTTGPAAIFYRPSDVAKGNFEVKATFTQTKPAAHREAYGLFIGGQNLDAPNQQYTYFEVAQTGEFLLKRRMGAQTPTVVNWTANPAVTKPDAAGKYTNTLSIVAGPTSVSFRVNGTEVATQPRSAVAVDGIAGLRVNHNLDVHIEGFGVERNK